LDETAMNAGTKLSRRGHGHARFMAEPKTACCSLLTESGPPSKIPEDPISNLSGKPGFDLAADLLHGTGSSLGNLAKSSALSPNENGKILRVTVGRRQPSGAGSARLKRAIAPKGIEPPGGFLRLKEETIQMDDSAIRT
jgi:hypothetical protein